MARTSSTNRLPTARFGSHLQSGESICSDRNDNSSAGRMLQHVHMQFPGKWPLSKWEGALIQTCLVFLFAAVGRYVTTGCQASLATAERGAGSTIGMAGSC